MKLIRELTALYLINRNYPWASQCLLDQPLEEQTCGVHTQKYLRCFITQGPNRGECRVKEIIQRFFSSPLELV